MVYVREFIVYETYNAGLIKRIWAQTSPGRWELLWGTSAVQLLSYARAFSPNVTVSRSMLATFNLYLYINNRNCLSGQIKCTRAMRQ